MPQNYRMIGRSAIEIVAVGMPLLGQQRIVIAESLHEFARGSRFVFDEFPDRFHDVVYAGDLPYRRRRQVKQIQITRHRGKMSVGIDEARQQRPFSQFHHLRFGTDVTVDFLPAAHGDNAVATDRDRFRFGFIHGDDVLAEKNQIRRRRRRLRRLLLRAATGEQRRQTEDNHEGS